MFVHPKLWLKDILPVQVGVLSNADSPGPVGLQFKVKFVPEYPSSQVAVHEFPVVVPLQLPIVPLSGFVGSAHTAAYIKYKSKAMNYS